MTTFKKPSLIHATDIDPVLQPIAEARGMPNSVYLDSELFEFERDEILGNTWAAIGYTSELQDTAYVKPLDFMGLSLLIMRNKRGDLNVFHNVCSHRGMVLVEEAGSVAGSIRCPYHSWTYNLDGDLRGTPHIGGVGVHTTEGFSCENHGLKAVRSSEWMGIIFINLSGQAESFNDYIALLAQRWEQFVGEDGLDKLQVAACGSRMTLDIRANWKLAVENYCEAYHLPWVHPDLNKYSPLDQHYNIIDNTMSGQGSYTYTLSETAGTMLPQFSNWPPQQIRQAEYLSLYPNVLLGLQADHAFAVILQPLANNRTAEQLQLYYVGEKATGDAYSDCRAAVMESWRVVFSEDVRVVEGMQKGRQSPGFQGGVFSPIMDAPTHHFHSWLAHHYSSAMA